MKQEMNPVVLMEEDYLLLKPYTERMDPVTNPLWNLSLAGELDRAIIVNKQAFPGHTIRLDSRVAVQDLNTNRIIEFTIVLPEQADMRQNKVSVLTPIGVALLGFRKGEAVSWKVPSGMKEFRIVEVQNRMTDGVPS